MRSRPIIVAVLGVLVALLPGHIAPVYAAPAWTFSVGQAPTGLTTAGQLALDQKRGRFFITNNTFPVQTEKGISFPDARPRVAVFSTSAQRTVRTIDLSGQPPGVYHYGPLPVPMAQIPDGIALDTTNRRVVTTNAHSEGITVFGMNDKAVTEKNLIPVPGGHPMGVATDNAGRAWVALYSQDTILVLDTATRRVVGRINAFHPTLMAFDAKRHRLYVGNNDYDRKKRNFLTVLDTRTNRIITQIPTTPNARPAIDSATGRIVTVSFISGQVQLIDPDSLTVVATRETGATPSSVVVDAQRRLVYATTLKGKTLYVFDADSLKVVATKAIPGEIHTLALDPGPGLVYGTQNEKATMMVVRPARG
ncbi:YncE family protein [Gordonia pseudamarae]|jgi:DNA-binding beta-propeller fold protein YncE|uniref:YncE family protein n=1 Tax=Gordonia pseudamarae TaxID=2831662 RepID=A0ABX6IEM0_9ACTN|nr:MULTISPECIES: YncE family protein [Gordonia]MBD0021639.1 YncE family protein [Gordonia sp. (in: high G+C Gram-positive bacteria)]QHN25376.1 YncE family protein [Gordonia pseudamarae]QHN34307.1 YncE family protein [Gordonia pseudamarae]